ncbi:MAG: sugar phosphate isomerase/epimerase family protein [Bacillota bacterium]
MKIGVSSSVYLHDNFENALKKISNLDLNYVEIWGEPPHLWVNNIDYNYLKKIKLLLNKYNLKPSYHGPAHDVDITSMNPGVKKESIKQHKRSLDIAKFLGVDVYVVHAGSFYPGDKNMLQKGLDRLYRSIDELLTLAQKNDIILAVENHPVNENGIFNNPKRMKKIIKDFNSPYLKATLDIGHANLTKYPVIDYIEELGKDIKHIHINDNDGIKDLHLVYGEGSLDSKTIIKKIKDIGFDGIGVLEIWAPDNPADAVNKSINYINSI